MIYIYCKYRKTRDIHTKTRTNIKIIYGKMHNGSLLDSLQL